MKAQQWERIKTIVNKALTLSGREKKTYLSTVCRENPAIFPEVEELLRSIEQSGEKQFMKPIRQGRKELVSDLSKELDKHTPGDDFIGSKFGPYRITEQLGSGGMGAVFKATRADGEFHHTVAIKLIKKGVDSGENIRRFKIEREILAGLHHPNIAQLHDGGVTGKGTPYLIMEYIDGAPIDRFCNEQKLPVKERLDLFKEVCAAVQFAHANLVVHRDLKTQNIYVTPEGRVKVLDFGIAKLLDPDRSGVTLLETRPGQKFWTPQYAAPEQVKGDPVTIATDIYALGVLLHKLLTDTWPLNLGEKNFEKVEHVILYTAPSTPSQCFAAYSTKQKKECAKLLKTTVAELANELKGDLDALVLKAIRKEPEYRYTSVNQLQEDIERYQSGVPLVARKGTLKYRTSKFIRRHKTGMTAAIVILLLTTGFAGFYTWRITQERDRAEVQAQKAEQITEFMMGLFEASDPAEALGDTVSVLEILTRGTTQAEFWNEQPAVKAQMLDVIGRVYKNLGNSEQAHLLHEQALAIRKSLYGEKHPEVATSLDNIAQVLRHKGNYNEAEPLIREALEMRQELLGDANPEVAESLNSLAEVLHDKGDYEAAEPVYRKALALRKELLGSEHSDVVESMGELAALMDDIGNYQAAENLYIETLSIKRKLLGPEHPEVATSINNLGHLMHRMGRFEMAEQYYKEALAMNRKIMGNKHPKTTSALNNLAMVFWDKGDYEAAEPLLREALALKQELLGDNHPSIAMTQNNLGYLLREKGDYLAAEPVLRKALKIRRELLEPDHPMIAQSLSSIAHLLKDKKDYETAGQLYNEALTILINKLGKEHQFVGVVMSSLAELFYLKNEYDSADSLYRETLVIYQKVLGQEHPEIASSLDGLGLVLQHRGELNAADSLISTALDMRRNLLGYNHPDVATSLFHLGQLHQKKKDYEAAETHFSEALQIMNNRLGNKHPRIHEIFRELIAFYEEWNKPEQAQTYREELTLAIKNTD